MACVYGFPVTVAFPAGTSVTPDFCGEPIGAVAGRISALQTRYQTAVAAAGPQSNPNYIGNAMFAWWLVNNVTFISPEYRTPYSIQANAGFQRELHKGTVLSVDYVRNEGRHYLLGIDANHVGDARYLNVPNAVAAMAATHMAFGCPPGTGGVNCAIAAGARISDYAGNGLTNTQGLTGGPPGNAAFAGINPAFGPVTVLQPIGRSSYHALQVSLRSSLTQPVRGIRNADVQVSYTLSRFSSMVRDQDVGGNAWDQADTNRYVGPNGMDRTHQLSLGAVLEFPTALRVSFTSHISTALPVTMTIPVVGTGGEIFQTDMTGDGTTGDILPGTNIGSFGRGVTAATINGVIGNYNNTVAGHITPAGQALVKAGLFTESQLVALGAVAPSVALAPAGQVGLDSLVTFDLRFGWVLKPRRLFPRLSGSVTIEPTVAVFNLFNVTNYDGPGQTLGGALTGQPGSINGTTPGLRTNRIGLGSGVFALGAPRQVEFGVRVSF